MNIDEIHKIVETKKFESEEALNKKKVEWFEMTLVLGLLGILLASITLMIKTVG